MKEKWLDKLLSRIQSENVKAPKGLLDDIKMEMIRRGIAPVHSTQQKVRIVPLWIYRSASVAAIFAVGLYLGDMLINRSPLSKQVAVVLDHNTNVASNSSRAEAKKRTPNIVKLVSAIYKDAQERFSDDLLLASNSNDVKGKEIGSNENTTERQQVTQSQPPERADSLGNARSIKQQTREYQGKDPISYAKNNARSSRFSIGTSYNGGVGTSSNTQGLLLASANPYGDYSPEFSGDNIQDYVTGSEGTRTATKHHQPIKFGMSVRYNIDNRWSLQTGLTYSRLCSDFSYSRGTESYVVEQNLHYVGLPVNASYSLVKTNRINLYTTVGGEIEKLVKGESKQTFENASKANSNNVSVKENNPMFSLNAAIGGEYRFSKDVSVYVEPGVSHHFNNGSHVENIYKDTPTNFNLNIGIRVNLNKQQ
ncbi:MAG: porin family protein [Prevotella sp.]